MAVFTGKPGTMNALRLFILLVIPLCMHAYAHTGIATTVPDHDAVIDRAPELLRFVFPGQVTITNARCYPDMQRLVAASAAKAKRIYAIVVPADRMWLRFAACVANFVVRRVLGWRFQSFVHSHQAIDAVCASQGLVPCGADPGFVWWAPVLFGGLGVVGVPEV
jgi:hypothetical protein